MAASHFQPAPAGQEALAARWEAGGAVGSAWAGSIRRGRRPRHQASRAKAARETRGRGRPAAAVAAGPLHAGLVVSRTYSQGLRRQANKASALASGKCSCLWLRACSLAGMSICRRWCYSACSGAGVRRGARALSSIRARDARHRFARSERDPRRRSYLQTQEGQETCNALSEVT